MPQMSINDGNQKWSSSWSPKASLQKLRFSIHPDRATRSAGQREGYGHNFVHYGLIFEFGGQTLKVSTPAVLRWVRTFAEKVYEKPEPREAIVVELDEMWHYLHSKKTNCGSGKLIVALPANSLTGNVGLVIKQR